MNARTRALRRKDKAYLWHPFTQMKEWVADEPLVIEDGRGAIVRDTDGRSYIDAIGSLWCNVHGHRRREIDTAVRRQLTRIAHSTLLGSASPPSILLAERLVALAPRGLTRVFYSDSGSTAVEVALKMAFQFWRQNGARRKKRFVALENAYHGDTLGAVSVGGISLFHATYRPLLFRCVLAPSSSCYRCSLGNGPRTCGLACAEALGEILARHHGEIAAVIVEPLVQAAAGILTAAPGYLRRVRQLCAKFDVFLIADEVAVGMGRTGRMFACEHERVAPDFLCLGKGLSGGYLPLAVTLTTERVFRGFLGEFTDFRTFYHGHTFTGNALACAAALANLEIFEKEQTLKRMRPVVRHLNKRLRQMAQLPHVGDVRQRGLLAGIELVLDKRTKEAFDTALRIGARICRACRADGILLRPLGDVIVMCPPLCITIEQIDQICDTVEKRISEVTSRFDCAPC